MFTLWTRAYILGTSDIRSFPGGDQIVRPARRHIESAPSRRSALSPRTRGPVLKGAKGAKGSKGSGAVVIALPDTTVAREDAADDDLVAAARAGDERAIECLLLKYRSYARAKARSYFIVGADAEDIIQEGMIGLYKAIRDYDPAAKSSFRAFAELCITRQVITAIKAATRHKHGPLNNYVSLSRPVSSEDDGERCLADVLTVSGGGDPVDQVISADRIRALQAHFDQALSDLEVEVLRLYVDGKSYQEIAAVLSRHVKSIDNALQRIKRKLDEHLRTRAVAEAG